MHRIASGAPRHSNASRGKTAFHIHRCFLRKGRKGTRESKHVAGFVKKKTGARFR